jgi:hypothetical protein
VPGDGFAFAVGVGGQVDGVRLGSLLLEGSQHVLAVRQVQVLRHPSALDIDAELALG